MDAYDEGLLVLDCNKVGLEEFDQIFLEPPPLVVTHC